jgi:hypothetical protein
VAETKTDLKETETRVRDLEHLAAIHFKGITQTLQALSRPPAFTTPPNENADIARTFGNIPLHGSTNSRSIEFRAPGCQSRILWKAEGMINDWKAAGYYEPDFLGAAGSKTFS